MKMLLSSRLAGNELFCFGSGASAGKEKKIILKSNFECVFKSWATNLEDYIYKI